MGHYFHVLSVGYTKMSQIEACRYETAKNKRGEQDHSMLMHVKTNSPVAIDHNVVV